VSNGTITAVISDYKDDIKHEELARKIWKEIDALRGIDSAFMPEYRIAHYQKATIKQDQKNNLLRPKNAVTEYSNVFIAGDWTMQNYPCCMEVAVQSAKRAVKTALKSK
jgi:thioredoxin reductase